MRIGIDIGGTKIEAIALEDADTVIARERVATPKNDYYATVATVISLIKFIEKAVGKSGSIGVGIPGTISINTGNIKNSNSTCLIGKPFDKDLKTKLKRPVRTANDADCFTLSEAEDGSAAGYASVFGVILGTGVGGGVVFDGSLIAGPNGISGEWGHNRLPISSSLNEPRCYCGKTGCIETYLSGPGLSRAHMERTGEQLNALQIGVKAETGDPEANISLEIFEDQLALALSMVINILDPEAIVLGGGLSNLNRLYENVPKKLATYVFSDTVETILLPPKHRDSSGVRGAARLWPENI